MDDGVAFYTVDEVAKQLRVTEQTIRRWIAEGKIPAIKVGRKNLIDAKAMDRKMAFLDVDAEQRRREHAAKT